MECLTHTAHRPWPLPSGPWIMAQSWHDLLFAHWRVPEELVRSKIPSALEVDTFDGSAWLGVVPFRMSGIRARWTPPMPRVSAFVEMNLRTYVRHRGQGGVWFFSLDATEPIAVSVARRWFHLPYFDARMSCAALSNGDVDYVSERTHVGAPPASFRGRYGPRGDVASARAGSLEHWLTERYCLFTVDGRRRLIRGDIHHDPWPLQPAESRIDTCTVPAAHGFDVSGEPLHVAFARRIDVALWAPRAVGDADRAEG
jgi:uncharacterized protein